MHENHILKRSECRIYCKVLASAVLQYAQFGEVILGKNAIDI